MSVPNAINQHETPIPDSANDSVVGAANSAASVVYSAGAAGVQHCIGGIAWSFSANPAAPATLSVSDGANVVFSVQITAGGPGYIPFTPPKKGSAATSMTITLGAGGSGVVGSLNVLAHWTEGPSP
jgi:hypothetical protein